MSNIVTFTSDFGDDFAKGQVELVIKSINPTAEFVTISNQVTPFSIIEGAFILQKFSEFTKPGSVHLAIVDPGVGSNRRGIIIRTKDFYFVGPDNGLLLPAAKRNGIGKAYTINEERIAGSLSNTFHGRDLFAKIAALLSAGKDPKEFANLINPSHLKVLNFQENQVLHIDNYGNIKINNNCSHFKIGDLLKVRVIGWILEIPFVKTFSDVDTGKLLAYKGSHNTLEIAKNLGFANDELNLKIGDIIKITQEDGHE